MYVLLIESRVKPGKKEEFVEGWSSKVLPLLRQQSGFVDELMLCDQEKQQNFVGLSFWKTREDAEHYRRRVFRKTKDLIGDLCSNPWVRGFEVEAAEIFNIGKLGCPA